jgi:hypothetical protein
MRHYHVALGAPADPDETPALERYFTEPSPPKRPKSHPE